MGVDIPEPLSEEVLKNAPEPSSEAGGGLLAS